VNEGLSVTFTFDLTQGLLCGCCAINLCSLAAASLQCAASYLDAGVWNAQAKSARGRFALIMEHQPADRVSLDLGATSLASADPRVLDRLRELLGFGGDEPASDDAPIDERILEALDVDSRRVGT